jgi:putative transcriptional regulator
MGNEKLKKARKEKKLTQEQMARRLGYKSKSGYNMIEKGRNQPPLRTALQIADLLDCDVRELFEGLIAEKIV